MAAGDSTIRPSDAARIPQPFVAKTTQTSNVLFASSPNGRKMRMCLVFIIGLTLTLLGIAGVYIYQLRKNVPT